MQGKQPEFQPELFTYCSWEKLVPQDHLLRKIDRALDLSFVRPLTAHLYCQDNGRPSVDPELFFKMQLIGYLYGIASDRRLCEEVAVNLAYRWYLKLTLEEEVPEHSSLTRIRDRLGEQTYRAVFEQVLQACKKTGLLRGAKILVDSSLVQADASFASLEQRELSEEESKKRYHSNRARVSSTDPDASIVARPGYYQKLVYKVHRSVDESSRLITDTHVTPGAVPDAHLLLPRIEYQATHLNLAIKEVTADKGYGVGQVYRGLRKMSIRSYIPVQTEAAGRENTSRGRFKYDRKRDLYVCPEGKKLTRLANPGRNETIRYRAIGGHCGKCPRRAICLTPNERRQRTPRVLCRNRDHDEINQARRRMQSVYFKSRLKRRMWIAEGSFAEAKNEHLLRRAKYRGLSKMQIQAYLVALTQNIKRMVVALISRFFQLLFACVA